MNNNREEQDEYTKSLACVYDVDKEINLAFSFYNIKPEVGEEDFWAKVDRMEETVDFLKALATRREQLKWEETVITVEQDGEDKTTEMYNCIKEDGGWITDRHLIEMFLPDEDCTDEEFINLIERLYNEQMLYSEQIMGALGLSMEERPSRLCLSDRQEVIDLLNEVQDYFIINNDNEVEVDQEETEEMDCTPTWESIMPIYLEAIYNQGRDAKAAIQEITRVAKIADKYNKYLKSKKP